MSLVTEYKVRRERRLADERREIERRKFLAGVLAAPVIIGAAKEFGEGTPASADTTGGGGYLSVPQAPLQPQYVYGIVQDVSSNSVTLEAPTADGVETVVVNAAPGTQLVYNKANPTLTDVPIGSRFEAGTTLINGDLTSRNAQWMFVNPMYSHGEIMANNGATAEGLNSFSLQQAHGGPMRNLLISDQARTVDGTTGAINVPISTFNVGCRVFYCGIAESPDLAEPNIHIVTISRVATTPTSN